jgi:hypothetical protein
MWSEFWPIFVLAALLWLVTRRGVWYWLIGLPWRLAWRALTRR